MVGVDEALKRGKRGDAGTVVRAGPDGREDRFEVGGGHVSQADQRQIGSRQGRRNRQTAGRPHQGVDHIHQRLHLTDGADPGPTLRPHHVVKQGQPSRSTGQAAQVHADVGVVGGGRAGGEIRIRCRSVGFGKNAVVAVHHVLNLGRGVGLAGGQEGKGGVDGGQVASAHPGDSGGGVVSLGRCGIAAGVVADHRQRIGGDGEARPGELKIIVRGGGGRSDSQGAQGDVIGTNRIAGITAEGTCQAVPVHERADQPVGERGRIVGSSHLALFIREDLDRPRRDDHRIG